MSENAREVSVSRVIDAPPEKIFAVLADPAQHPLFDGSGTVRKSNPANPERLELGSKFGMDMRVGLPYKIRNTVVEYDENELIAWCHPGHHRWRYQLDPVDGGTRVTETFDWSTARSPRFIELMGYPRKHPKAMDKTLERLDGVVTSASGPAGPAR
jgi:uncharacterized protein YndB with AHSA1/START domain